MRFYLSVSSYQKRPPPFEAEARRIYETFLAPDALDSVNVDAGGVARVKEAIDNNNIDGATFDEAQVMGVGDDLDKNLKACSFAGPNTSRAFVLENL